MLENGKDSHLMYLAMLLGYFFVSAHAMRGAIAPTRKKNVRALEGTISIKVNWLKRSTLTSMSRHERTEA